MAQYEYQFLTEGSGSYINDLAAEAITKHALCYFDPAGNGWLLADADAAATMPVVGISMAAIPTTRKGRFLLKGFIGDSAWTWTPNGIIYASTTAGALTQTPPAGAGDTVQAVGIARSSTIIWFDPAGFGGVGSSQEFSPETAIVGFNGNLSSAPNYFLCDGTADEVQINAAIAYVGALGGGSVFLERGTYTLAGSVLMNQADVLISGQGWDTVIDGNTSGHALSVTGVRCVVKHVQLKTTSGGGSGFDGINSVGGNDLRVENVYISESDRIGIAYNSTRIKIINCYIKNTDSEGIEDNGADSIITDNFIENTGSHGIIVQGSGDGAVISHNNIDTTGATGVALVATAEGCIVTDNNIRNWSTQPVDDDSDSSVVRGNNAGGDVLNSNGVGFSTIQDAVDDLGSTGGWVEVPNRTFTESVVISNADIMIRGVSWESGINGTTTHAITITGARCIIKNLRCSTTAGGGNAYNGINSTADYLRVENVFVSQSDRYGIAFSGTGIIVKDCYLDSIDEVGIDSAGLSQIYGCNINNCGDAGITISSTGDGTIISGNIIDTTGNDGIIIADTAENCIVTGNTITGWTGEPVDDDSGTSVVTDNNAGGTVMNSKGCAFATVQASIDHLAGDGWVEVPDGTWSEALTITNAGVVLRGQGWSSIIDGGTTGHAISLDANSDRALIRDLTVNTTPGQGNSYDGINVASGAFDVRIINVRCTGSDRDGFNCDSRVIVEDCKLELVDEVGIQLEDEGDNSIIGKNFMESITGNDIDIHADAENCIIIGNRLVAGTINDASGTSTVVGNDTT